MIPWGRRDPDVPPVLVPSIEKGLPVAGRRLNQYQGSLTHAQIAAGCNAALRTAKSLAADARLLLDNERFARAASLAVLAIEEAGKVSILRGFAIAESHELKTGWRHYRSHTSKNRMAAILDYISGGANRLEDFRGMFANDAEHASVFDIVKQIGFYSDCCRYVNWSEPANVIDEKLAQTLVMMAEAITKTDFVTEQEMQLWSKHFGCVDKRDLDALKTALFNWYEDMQRHGLAPEGENQMRRFAEEGFRDRTTH
jgi:AbiV family abortive infection protein